MSFYTGMAVLLFALAVALLSGSAAAQDASARQLGTVVVTATGQEAGVEDVLASVAVIDREQLDRHGDGGVVRTLRHTAGVQTSSSGSTGDIAIRGFNRNHTLLLVDGLRRTNNYGGNNAGQLPYFDVERVEIVRGPLSSLYGSEALGGVVNVITRHPGDDPGTTVAFRAGSAEGGRHSMHSGLNVRTGDSTLGHSWTIEQDYRSRLRHRGSVGDDFPRLNNGSGSYRGRWRPDATRSLSWAMEAFERDSAARDEGSTGAYTRFEKERRYFGSLDYRQRTAGGELVMRGSAGQSKGRTSRSHPEIESTYFRQYQADAVYHFAPHDAHLLSVGTGVLRDEIDVSINERAASRTNRFVLIQDQWEITSDWEVVAGVRVDHFDDFGQSVNPRISLGWNHGAWNARLGYGTGFRAPSLLEQYSSFTRGSGPRAVLIQGNPDLDPEESRTWEAMLRRDFSWGGVELTVHQNRVDGLIEAVPTGAVNVREYRNVDRARIKGAELMAHWSPGPHWFVSGGLDWLDARDVATGDRLSGRAQRTWRLEVLYERGPWEVAVRAHRMEKYLAVGIDAPRHPPPQPYNRNLTRVDLGLSYAWSDAVSVFAGIDNLFDRRDPDNFTVTATGNQRNDPDARYVYAGARIDF